MLLLKTCVTLGEDDIHKNAISIGRANRFFFALFSAGQIQILKKNPLEIKVEDIHVSGELR